MGPTLSILAWICIPIGLLQTYYTSCLIVVTPLQETDDEADGIAHLLAHGRQAWWDRDITQLLDNLVQRSVTKCAAVLASLIQCSMDVYDQSKDYAEGNVIPSY